MEKRHASRRTETARRDEIVEVVVERPVAGGRMLARGDDRIVFVTGAVPGERVRARVTRRTKQIAWADAVDVLEPSPDRRASPADAACGGLDYVHLSYARQLACKAEIVADAFRRIAKHPIADVVPIAPSPERGYRLRARLHVRGGRAGFFRTGTHELCDAAPGGQLTPASLSAVGTLLTAMASRGGDCDAVVVAENVLATQRVLHLEPRPGARLDDLALDVGRLEGVTGVSTSSDAGVRTIAGVPTVTDCGADLFVERRAGASSMIWTRHAPSFFQSNRFVTGTLVADVLDGVPGEAVADLYAGVGLFAIAFAARGARVLAVEGESSSGADLCKNAAPWGDRVEALTAPVEDVFAQRVATYLDAVVVDPPRTGLSPAALAGLLRWRPPRIAYISCDPPTLARDAAHFFAAGFRLDRLRAYDLFPNTSHVETMAVFVRDAVTG